MAIKLVEHNKSKHGKLNTGPVDNEIVKFTDIPCPECENTLIFIPEQVGHCHSGKYQTAILIDHYWCDDNETGCGAVFIEDKNALILNSK